MHLDKSHAKRFRTHEFWTGCRFLLSPTHARPVLTATLNCSQVTAALFTSSPRDHVFDFVTANVQTFFFCCCCDLREADVQTLAHEPAWKTRTFPRFWRGMGSIGNKVAGKATFLVLDGDFRREEQISFCTWKKLVFLFCYKKFQSYLMVMAWSFYSFLIIIIHFVS
jgi:hypothetical protein